MKRQRFHCFIRAAQKHGDPFEWKIGETPQLANNGKSTTCTMDNFELLVPGLSSVPAAVCLQHRDQRIRKIIPENLGLLSDPVTTRSDKHACGKPMLTDPDKQATGNREPACEFFFRRDVQGGSNARLSWLVTALHSSSRTGDMCSHIPLKERTQIRKVMLQKWGHRKGSTVFWLTSTKDRKRSIPRTEEIGDLKTVERKSESRNNHQFAAVVQDLTIFSGYCPWKTKTSQEMENILRKFKRAVTEAQSYSYGRF